MAVTITVTALKPTQTGHPGRAGYLLSLAETSGTATSEKEIVLADEGLPTTGMVISQYNTTAPTGTATTIDPVLGTVTDPGAASGWRVENDTAAALVHNQPTGGAFYTGVTSFFHRAQYDAGADNACTVNYLILEGW